MTFHHQSDGDTDIPALFQGTVEVNLIFLKTAQFPSPFQDRFKGRQQVFRL